MSEEITITVSREEAERISDGLSDLLCWCRGFRSALGEDANDRAPFGDWAAREARITINKAIGRATP